MTLPRTISALACAACLVLGVAEAEGQGIARVPEDLLRAVMPEADRFAEPSGDPPVIAGYASSGDGGESLLGYVFLTSDLPPEQYGYSGPIEALVGMTLDGTLTGVRVTDYRESYMRQMGDFLRRRGFQEQFEGKFIGDPFRVWGDVDGISRVSISVRALARGVRDAARRVAAAYAGDGSVALPLDPVTDVAALSWFELRRLGVIERFEVTEPGEGSAGISLAYIGSDRTGEHFFGRVPYERALRSMERRGGADHLLMYAVDGSRLRLFLQEGWSIVQDGDTTAIAPADVVMLGMPSEGLVATEATLTGVMLVKRELDIRKPFTVVYDLGALGVHSVEYRTQEARMLAAEAAAVAEVAGPEEADSPAPAPAVEAPLGAPGAGPETPESSPEPAAPEAPAPDEAGAAARAEGTEAVPPGGAEPPSEPPAGVARAEPPPQLDLDFAVSSDETLLARLLSETSWGRVAIMLLVLALGAAAFFAKTSPWLRWTSLGATLVLLGFVDGGFLSISHVTSGIWAGAGVYLRDLPLLLIVVFTVVTTLVWGRVFCGFLCPFGALQDAIDRVVPRSWQRELPRAVHDRAVWVKYGVLALIVLPALAGSHASFYQWFEPFGTVFFLSPSLLLWAIALGYLAASAVVPRFYCRYACPLGAALGVVSLLSLRRIPRVEQCEHCSVCEQRCPTGAIRGPAVDFKECVRCNVCEVQLLERRGVCRHEMQEVRARLVQLELRRTVGSA